MQSSSIQLIKESTEIYLLQSFRHRLQQKINAMFYCIFSSAYIYNMKLCNYAHVRVYLRQRAWGSVALRLLPKFCCCFPVSSPISIPGEMRVQLLNQTLLDLGFYDDGPYEVADQKELNAQLIPLPYHSYLGRICPPCSLLPVHRRESEGRRRGDTRAQTVPQTGRT